MKTDVSGIMKRFSGAMIQPVMFLAAAGILLSLCVIMRMSFFPAPIVAVGDFIYNLMMNGMMNNLAVIFTVGLTCALAKKQKTDAAVISIVSFLCFLYANNGWLAQTGGLIEAESLVGTGQAMVFGVQVIDMGVFVGLILGSVNGWLFNKFCDVKFPDVVRIYGGTRLVMMLCVFAAALIGIAACYVWPLVSGALISLQGFIEGSGNIGLFVYGFLNRALIPTGLHHLIYMPFMFSSVGGVAEIAGETYVGATPIYLAELGNLASITQMDPSVKYMIFGFAKIFGSIGTVLAFIATAKPEKKAETRALLIPLAFTAVVAGITEPLEFMYLFVSPLLFLVHSVLDGLFQVILFVAGYSVQLSNITTIFTSLLIFPQELSHQWVIIPVGLGAIFAWFVIFRFLILKFNLKTPGREDDGEEIDLAQIGAAAAASLKPGASASAPVAATEDDSHNIQDLIDGLGGSENIESVLNCFTRLRVDLVDMGKIDEAVINRYENKGIVRGKNNVQIIIGMKVQDVCDSLKTALGRPLE